MTRSEQALGVSGFEMAARALRLSHVPVRVSWRRPGWHVLRQEHRSQLTWSPWHEEEMGANEETLFVMKWLQLQVMKSNDKFAKNLKKL